MTTIVTIVPDYGEVREFFETYVAQARAATTGMAEPGRRPSRRGYLALTLYCDFVRRTHESPGS